MVILFALVRVSPCSSARPEGVGELRDGENAFAVELFSILLGYTTQQAKVVFLYSLLPASGLKLTLDTMPI